MRTLSSTFAGVCLSRSARLATILFLIILVTLVQHDPQRARAQARSVAANITAWQTLQNSARVPVGYAGSRESVGKLQSGTATPLAMASADLDGDGIADLVVGFAQSGSGMLALHRGNLDAFAPQSHASLLATAREQFPPAFLPQASVIDIPEAPQFIVTGDFAGNGKVDIVAGARGGHNLYLLMAAGKGKFSQPRQIPLPGALTALAAGQIGGHDGKADLAVGIKDQNGASVLVYKTAAGGLISAHAVSYAVPQAATQLEISDLHGDGFADIAAVTGTQALIIHPTAAPGSDTTALVTPVPVGGTVRSIAVGSFVWERAGRNQIAVLLQSGVVQVLSAAKIDTRPFSAEERAQGRRMVVERIRQSTATATQKVKQWSPGTEQWSVVRSGSVTAPVSANVRLMGVSLAHARPLDLMVVDSADSRVHVLPADTTGEGSDPAELLVETGDAPVAVLPARVNIDGRPGLIILGRSSTAPRTMAPLPDPTYYVNRTDDPAATTDSTTVTGTCNNTSLTDTSSSCSLRQAIIKANSVSGTDTIVLPSGTITLTQTGLMENYAVTGDLDVRDSVNIVGQVDGSGNPTTTIQGCGGSTGITCSPSTVSAWNDKFISTNKDGTTDANLSIANLIFQNGNNTNTGPDPDFNYLAGAVDFDGCGQEVFGCGSSLPVASLTITNSQFLSNTAAGCGGNACGGGVDAEGGAVTISDSVFSANNATGLGGALMLLTCNEQLTIASTTFNKANQSSSDGGAIYMYSQNNNLSVADASVVLCTGNLGIHGSTISGNVAAGQGGGLYLNYGASDAGTPTPTPTQQGTITIDQGTVISNNSAHAGGGIDYLGITPSGDDQTSTLTITNATMTGNSAIDSSGIGGGAIVVNGGGTLNVSFSRIVGNTTAAAGDPTGISIEQGGSATVTANDNWWGCNAGPSTTPCDTVAIVGGSGDSLSDSRWITLALTASPSKIKINGTTTLTASMAQENDGSTLTSSQVPVLSGLPVTFQNAVLGTIQQTQPESLNTSGQATATYNAGGTGGAGSAEGTVDAQTDTVNISVLEPPSISTSFSPVTVAPSTPSTLSFTITNGNTAAIDASFTDTLPAGLTVSSAPSVSNGCGGTVTATAGAGSISFANSDSTPGSGLAAGTCTITVNVQAATDGTYSNSVTIDSADAGNGNTSTATLTVVAPPSISKSFGAATIPVNGTTTLSFNINNPNSSTTLSGISFTDSLPAGLIVATSPNLTSTCAGTAVGTAGASSAALSGSSLAPGAACMVSLNVTGTTAGVKYNTVQVASSNGGTGNTSTASMAVVAPPSLSKSFGAASIPLNGSTSLSFTVSNPNAGSSLTGVSFSDTLPAGLIISTPNGLTGTCGAGTIIATQNSGMVSLSNGSLTGGGSCSFSVNVTGIAAGGENNTTSAVTSNEGGTGNTASASVVVVAPPSISKSFNPSTISVGANTSLMFTIANPSGNSATETGVAFSDILPAGMVIANPNGLVNNCGGTAAATAGGSSLSLSGGSIAVGASCTLSVNITGTSSGQYTNTTGFVSSTNGGTGNTASANLTVASPPSMTKSFGAASIALNGTTSMTFNLTNPNAIALTGIQFTDSLPAGLVVTTTPTNTCGGTASMGSGGATLSLTGGSIAAGGSCSVSTTVQGTTPGVKNNSTTVSSGNGGTGNTATASITVVAPPSLSKSFGAASVALNGTTSLSFSITNPNPTIGLTGVGFTDTLPGNIAVPVPNGLSGSCGTGTITVVSGGISLSGGSIAAGGSCSFSVNVTGKAAGAANNTTSAVTSNEGGTGNTASATLYIESPPSIAKAFNPALISVGATTSLGFTISNSASNPMALAGVSFTDVLPAGLTVVNGSATACGGTLTTSGGNTISLSGASIAVGGQCTPSVTVTGTQSGTFNNVTGNVTSTNGGTGNAATASLQVADYSVSLLPNTETIPTGHMATFTLTVSSTTGFQGEINLVGSGGPPGSTVTIKPSSVTLLSGSQMAKVTMTLAVPNKAASKGTWQVKVTASSKTTPVIVHTATATLTVGLNQ